MIRNGEYQLNSDPPITPCPACPKIPADVREAELMGQRGALSSRDALDPEDMHYAVVDHFLKCDAVRRFPKDHWTKEFVYLIRGVKNAADNRPMQQLLDKLNVLFARGEDKRA